MLVDQIVAGLALRQYGVVCRGQLLARGIGAGAIRHRLETGAWHQLHRAVYAVGHEALAPLGVTFAAMLAAGPRAAVSHASSAQVYGMLPWEPGVTHVTCCTARGGRRGTLLVHRVRHLPEEEVWHRHGMRLTSPSRVLLELAATEPQATVARALGQGEVLRIVSRAGVVRDIERWGGQRGAGVLRELMGDDLRPAPTRSWLEDVFLPLVEKAGLPRPRTNVWVHGYLVDAYWEREGVVVELDSRRFHRTPTAFEADRARDARLAAHGLSPMRFTHRRVTREPYAVVAELSAALRAAVRRAAA